MPERDIYRNFRYQLDLGAGMEDGVYFTEVTGLGVTVECIEFREGGNKLSSARKLTGRVDVHPVELRWGMTSNRQMWEWLMSALSGKPQRKTVSILILDHNGEETARWVLNEAWVSDWKGPILDALGNEVAIQSMTVRAETVEWAADGNAPEAAEGAEA